MLKIRQTSYRESLFLCNISKIPKGVVSTQGFKDPDKNGWAYIKASAQRKEIKITVSHSGGTWSGSYTTPDGTETSHVEQTTLEYIAQRIVSDMGSVTGVTVRRTGSYIFFQGNSSVSGLSVTTDSGSTYLGTARSSKLREY